MRLRNNKLYFRCDSQDCSIELENILYIEATGDYVSVYDTEQKRQFIFLCTLKKCTDTLGQHNFAMCYRSYIINMAHVMHTLKRESGYKVLLRGNVHLPIGRRYRKSFCEAYALFKTK